MNIKRHHHHHHRCHFLCGDLFNITCAGRSDTDHGNNALFYVWRMGNVWIWRGHFPPPFDRREMHMENDQMSVRISWFRWIQRCVRRTIKKSARWRKKWSGRPDAGSAERSAGIRVACCDHSKELTLLFGRTEWMQSSNIVAAVSIVVIHSARSGFGVRGYSSLHWCIENNYDHSREFQNHEGFLFVFITRNKRISW